MLTNEFIVEKEKLSIKVIKQFDAPVLLVWKAYTTQEVLERWWAPLPFKTITKSMDFSEGGHWHYSMKGPNGEEHWSFTSYKQIIFEKLFTGFDSFCDANATINSELPQSLWEVSFEDNGDATVVTTLIRFSTLEQLEGIITMGFKEGYSQTMDHLNTLLKEQKI